jgi:hypothetical protein
VTQSTIDTLRDEIRARLDGTSWTLVLKPMEEGQKTQKDTLTFQGREVTSQRLTKAGYNSSNYSVNIGGDGVAVWETMQTKEGEGVAFWRGELQGETMQGVLSQQPTEGPVQAFSFTATQTGVTEKSQVPPAGTQPTQGTSATAAQAPAGTPQAAPPTQGSERVSTQQPQENPAAIQKPQEKRKRRGFLW